VKGVTRLNFSFRLVVIVESQMLQTACATAKVEVHLNLVIDPHATMQQWMTRSKKGGENSKQESREWKMFY